MSERSALERIREERQKAEHGYISYYHSDTTRMVINERVRLLSWVEDLLEGEAKIRG